MSKEAKVNRLAMKLAKLVGIFRQGGKSNDFHWWNENSPKSIFYPLHGYQDGQSLFDAVVQGVLSLNPEMLSQQEVERKIVYEFLQAQTISVTQPDHLNGKSLVGEAENHLNQLIEFEAWQDVLIPIANLWHEGEPVRLHNVTFTKVTEDELEKWKKNLKFLWPEEAPDIHVLAQVRAPGDQARAISYSRNEVNTVIEVLRAFCFPFGRDSDTWRVGVLGDVLSSNLSPMSIDNRRFLAQVGPGTSILQLEKHILSKLEKEQWKLIDKLLRKTQYSKMERKLRVSTHWLGESTKPDTNNAKFAKICFALETLIGGEPTDEDLKVRGITAMLAERAAFIAGGDLDERVTIDRAVRKYYAMRSNIVHGGEQDASLDDIDGFGNLVRYVALALLQKLDELGDEMRDVEKLEKWVQMQRYTLPNDSSKEVF